MFQSTEVCRALRFREAANGAGRKFVYSLIQLTVICRAVFYVPAMVLGLRMLGRAVHGPCYPGGHSWLAGESGSHTKEADLYHRGTGEPLNNSKQGE